MTSLLLRENESQTERISPRKKFICNVFLLRSAGFLKGKIELKSQPSLTWPFLLKFLCTKIVKQFVFLVQSIVFQHMFLNL